MVVQKENRQKVTIFDNYSQPLESESTMTETYILDMTFDILIEKGANSAYSYLTTHLNYENDLSSQTYNYLYCLAAMTERQTEALKWLHQAIIEKELWYRPDVFEDSDLDSLRDFEEFKNYIHISNKRYIEALKKTKTIFTWTSKKEDNLMIIFHGNQQNNTISRTFWNKVHLLNCQTEYIQSKEMDSFDLFRWNDDGDGPAQFESATNNLQHKILHTPYKSINLIGFSSGCNTILRIMLECTLPIDHIVLFSPWIPMIETQSDNLFANLLERGTKITIVCGKKDEDCLPNAFRLEADAKNNNLPIEVHYIEDLGHVYPDDLDEWSKRIFSDLL